MTVVCIVAICTLLAPGKPACDTTKPASIREVPVEYAWQCPAAYHRVVAELKGTSLRPTRFEHGSN